MMPTKSLIYTLQDHFNARGRIANAMLAIKTYTKDSSYFYSCKDGWGNKKCINLPLEAEDILPILQKYIDNIDKDIIYSSIEAEINSEEDLTKYVELYKQSNPKTYANIEILKHHLRKMYADRMIANDNHDDEEDDEVARKEPYRIQVCSDINDKFYEFWCIGRCKNTLLFGFNGIDERKQ